MKLTKRILAIGAGLLLALPLAACGGDSDTGGAPGEGGGRERGDGGRGRHGGEQGAVAAGDQHDLALFSPGSMQSGCGVGTALRLIRKRTSRPTYPGLVSWISITAPRLSRAPLRAR